MNGRDRHGALRAAEIPSEDYRFDSYPEYIKLKQNLEMLESTGLGNPFLNQPGVPRTRIQPPSARAAARAWRAHPEAGDGPAKLPPPQADGAERDAVSREHPTTAAGQPPVAAQADGAEPDAVSREHPVPAPGQPPAAAQTAGAERDAVSEEHPTTGAGQPPGVAQADGAEVAAAGATGAGAATCGFSSRRA